MPLYKFQVQAAGFSLLPRDRMINDLYFSRISPLGDNEGLCEDLAAIFRDFWYQPGEIRVNMYDQPMGGPSGPPIATAVVNEGSAMTPTCPQEVALCLSFWAAERNNPSRRGRIYLNIACSAFSADGYRPSAGQITAALNLGDEIVGLGGADVSWQVYSRKLAESNDVTNTWVDNEWDTIRSRGLRATTQESRGV